MVVEFNNFLYLKLKEKIHSESGKKYEKAHVVSFTSQTVAGKNYFIKVLLFII
jgi:hypothetical protein